MRWIKVAAIVLAVAILAGGIYWLLAPGIRVTVHNGEPTTLRSVTVLVTGRSYPIGDLAPGEEKSVRVQPTGESGVAVSFVDATGLTQTTDWAGPYLEPGYRGRIVVDVKDGKLVVVSESIRSSY